MKAITCQAYGPPDSLTLDDLPTPIPQANEVLIAVEAAGVNFPDTLIIQGQYQFQPPLPFSPGSEVAGTIIGMGDQVNEFKIGQRVMALTGFGAFAQQALAQKHNVFPIPDSMDSITAAGFPMAYGTSYYALKQRANLAAHETLLVLGASGGVGLAAVELGKLMGATVIAAASSDEKLAHAKEYGADHLINYQSTPLKEAVKALTHGVGVDVVYDPVGGALFEQSLRAINWQGRYLVVGFASGEIPQLAANLVLLKGCQVVGVFWGAFAGRQPQDNIKNFAQLMNYYQHQQIKPKISEVIPMSNAAKALNQFVQRQVVGKVVLKMDL